MARAGRGSTAEQRVPLAETRLLLNQERLEPASEVFVPRELPLARVSIIVCKRNQVKRNVLPNA